MEEDVQPTRDDEIELKDFREFLRVCAELRKLRAQREELDRMIAEALKRYDLAISKAMEP